MSPRGAGLVRPRAAPPARYVSAKGSPAIGERSSGECSPSGPRCSAGSSPASHALAVVARESRASSSASSASHTSADPVRHAKAAYDE